MLEQPPTVSESMDGETIASSRPFLLMQGGPLYNLQKRIGIIKANASITIRRAYIAGLLAWIPLFILSAINGRAIGHAVPIPFLRDFSGYTRFLIALPLLLAAETILGPRIAEAAAHFITSGVVLEKDYKRFNRAVDLGLENRDSRLAEVIMVVLAYIFAFITIRTTSVHIATWYADSTDNGLSPTAAGWWLFLFSIPLMQFLTLRWIWRILLWFQFLWRMNNVDLQLFPTHPDHAGGLGFIGETQRFFGILLFAESAAVAGVVANAVIYGKTPLTSFAPAIATYVVLMIAFLLAPVLVFVGTLLRTKRIGLEQYGTLATTYTGSFHKKWIRNQASDRETLLGTGDIQSLADLGNSFALIDDMRPIPLDPKTALHLLIACLLPMVPLLLTVMPLKELLKLLLKVAA
jgi:hypothetical protein